MSQTQVKNVTKPGEPVKERSNMVKARLAARLSQKKVAKKMGVHYTSIINWEKAHTVPQLSQIEGLRDAIGFTGTDEELLQVFVVGEPTQGPMVTSEPEPQPCHTDATHLPVDASDSHLFDNEEPASPSPCHTEATHDKMDTSDCSHSAIQEPDKELSSMDKLRRAINNAIGTTFVGVNLQVITAPLIPSEAGPPAPPEEYIPQCTLIIESCWGCLNRTNYNKVERALQRTMPTLRRCANTRGPYQNIAANLAMQANVMQILLATRKHNFVARETFCAEAVHFGRLSGNSGILATALDWQANTYTVCYHQPQTAIPILNGALSVLNSESPLIKSAICSNLSVAYAQEGDEIEAMKYAELAQSAMPTYPELDPFSQCIRFNHSALDTGEGIAYLYLAEHSPKSDYAQKAYDAFDEATNKQAVGPDDLCSSLIRKADAARALGDMRGCMTYLTDGFRIAVEMDSIRRFSQAGDVVGEMPPAWLQETAVQKLQKDITHAIVMHR